MTASTLEDRCIESIVAALLESMDSKYLVAVNRFRHPLSGCGIPATALQCVMKSLARRLVDKRTFAIPRSERGFWLEALDVASCMVRAEEPATLTSMGLRCINCNGLNLSFIERLSNLRCVVLHGPVVSDSLADTLSRLNLSALVLSGHGAQSSSSGRGVGGNLSEAGISLLGICTSLTCLSLRGTSTTDTAVASLRRLTSLTWLDVSNTRLGNRGLSILSKCDDGPRGAVNPHGVENQDDEVAVAGPALGRGHQGGASGLVPSRSCGTRLGMHSLRWFKAIATLVDSKGAASSAVKFPALCGLEWGTSDRPRWCKRDGLVVRGDSNPCPMPASGALMDQDMEGGGWLSIDKKANGVAEAKIKMCKSDDSSPHQQVLDPTRRDTLDIFTNLCNLLHYRMESDHGSSASLQALDRRESLWQLERDEGTSIGRVSHGAQMQRKAAAGKGIAPIKGFEGRFGTVRLVTVEHGINRPGKRAGGGGSSRVTGGAVPKRSKQAGTAS